MFLEDVARARTLFSPSVALMIRTHAVLPADLTLTGIDVDARGSNCYLLRGNVIDLSLLRISTQGGPIDDVRLTFLEDKADVWHVAVHPEGDTLYVRTWDQGIWAIKLTETGAVQHEAELVAVEDASAGMEGEHTHMQCTGSALYYLLDKRTLMRVELATRKVSRHQMDEFEGMPCEWVVIESGSAQHFYLGVGTGNSYTHVLQVDLSTGTHTKLTLPDKGRLLCGTGDGKLVVATHDDTCLSLWDPNISAPFVQLAGTPKDDESYSSETAACDVWGTQIHAPSFSEIMAAAVDGSGRLWLLDRGTYVSVRCVYTSLVPPKYTASVLQPSTSRTSNWEVGGGTGSVISALARMLQDGQHADVQLRLAGGETLLAHSLILRAMCTWFEARLDRYNGRDGPGAATEAAADIAAGAGSHAAAAAAVAAAAAAPAYVVDLTDQDPDTVRALVHYLYTGSAQLDQVISSSSHAAGPGPSSVAAAAVAPAAKGQQPAAAKAKRTRGKAAAAAAACAGSSTVQQVVAEEEHVQLQRCMLLVRLLHAAEFFGVQQLHGECLAMAGQVINAGCALAWLVFAHEKGEQELKQLALKFVVDHYKGEQRREVVMCSSCCFCRLVVHAEQVWEA